MPSPCCCRIAFGVSCFLSCLVLKSAAGAASIQVRQTGGDIIIETDQLQARIHTRGYVTGIASGSFVDKKTHARDLGFGLHIMDFLLAPGWKDDGYPRDRKLHGDLPKHYIEGPQICTQAKALDAKVIEEKDFVAVQLRWQFTQAASGLKAGSRWEQVLLFQRGVRYVLTSERITSVNTVHDLFYRIDMPGHIRHHEADVFNQVYLSYMETPISASAFNEDFAPDARYFYQRHEGKVPARMIRAYQIKIDHKPGPWLAGMTLDPSEVCEAWCHERGYVCMIEELHRKNVQAGESFGAAYVVGYFDDVAEMAAVYDRYRGAHAIVIEHGRFRLE